MLCAFVTGCTLETQQTADVQEKEVTTGQATAAASAPDFAATEKDAESGDAKAQFKLRSVCENGEGASQDYAEAVSLGG